MSSKTYHFSKLFIERLDQVRGNESKAKFNKKIGLNNKSEYNIRNGLSSPTLELMTKIANRCDISLTWLVTGRGEVYPPDTIEVYSNSGSLTIDKKDDEQCNSDFSIEKEKISTYSHGLVALLHDEYLTKANRITKEEAHCLRKIIFPSIGGFTASKELYLSCLKDFRRYKFQIEKEIEKMIEK